MIPKAMIKTAKNETMNFERMVADQLTDNTQSLGLLLSKKERSRPGETCISPFKKISNRTLIQATNRKTSGLNDDLRLS